MRETEWHYRDGVGFRIASSGHVEIGHPDDYAGYYVKPDQLRDALRALGVLDGAEKPAERRPDASARVRGAWLTHAATDETERANIAAHATAARLRRASVERARERAAQERARRAGRRYFRDRDGDVWVTNPTGDGRLRLYRMSNGQAPEVHEWNAEARVRALHGPLMDVTFAEVGRRDAEKAATFARIYGSRTGRLPSPRQPERFHDRSGRTWTVDAADRAVIRYRKRDGSLSTRFRREVVERVAGPLVPVDQAAEARETLIRYAERRGGLFNV